MAKNMQMKEKKDLLESKKVDGKKSSSRRIPNIFKNRWVISLMVVFVLIIAVVLLIPSNEPVINVSDRNSNIYSMLVAVGIEEALVDAKDEEVIVEYELPDGVDKKESWYYVMGVVAGVSPQSGGLFIQATVDGNPTEKVNVKVKDVIDFQNAKLDLKEFEDKVRIS